MKNTVTVKDLTKIVKLVQEQNAVVQKTLEDFQNILEYIDPMIEIAIHIPPGPGNAEVRLPVFAHRR